MRSARICGEEGGSVCSCGACVTCLQVSMAAWLPPPAPNWSHEDLVLRARIEALRVEEQERASKDPILETRTFTIGSFAPKI